MDLQSFLPVLSMLSFVRAQTTNSMSMDWGILGGPESFGPVTTPSLMPDVGTMGGGIDPSMAVDNGAQGGTGVQANQANAGVVDWFSLGVEPAQFTYDGQGSQTTKRPSTSTAFPPISTTFKSNFLPVNTNPQYNAQNPQYNTQSFSAKGPSFSSKPNSQIQIFEKPAKMSFIRQNSRLKPAAVVSDSHKRSSSQLQAVKQTVTKQEQNGNSWSAFSPNRNPSRGMNPQRNNKIGSKSGWTEQTNNKWSKQQPVQKNSWSIRSQPTNSNTNNGGSTGGWQAIPNQDRLKETNSKVQQPKHQAQTFKDLRISVKKVSNNEFKISQNRPGRAGATNQVRTSNGQMRNQRQDNGFRNRNNNSQNERQTNESKGRQRVVMVATRSNTQPRFQEQSTSNSGPEQRGRSRDRSSSGPSVHFTSSMKRQNEEPSAPRRSVSKSDWSIIAPAKTQDNQQTYTNEYQPEPSMPRKERQVNHQNWQTPSEIPSQQQLIDKPPERSPVLSQPIHRQRISNRAETNSQAQRPRSTFQMPSLPPSSSFREQNQPSDQLGFQQNSFPSDNQYQQQQQQPDVQMSGQEWSPQIQQPSQQSQTLQNEVLQNIRTLLNQQQQLQKQQVQWQKKQLEIQNQQQMLQAKNVQAMNKFSNTISGLMSTFTNMQTGIDKMQTMIGKFLAAV